MTPILPILDSSARDLVPWGLLLVIAAAAGIVIYVLRAEAMRSRAAARQAEESLRAGSARLAALIEKLQAVPADDRLADRIPAPSHGVAAAEPGGPFAEEAGRLAGLFADQAARLQESTRLVESAQWELAERHRAEDVLRYRAAFERLAVNLAGRFAALAPDDVDDGIGQGLADIGRFAGVDRGCVFLLSTAGATMDNSHEWCAEGVEAQMDGAQDIPTEGFGWSMTRLRSRETIHIPLVSALPSEAAAEREFLERRGARSAVLTPMTLDEELVGFLGFEAVRDVKTWSDEDLALLGILGTIVADALERAGIVWTTW